jgi:hypothetical protein
MADELDQSESPKTAIAQDAGNPAPPSDSPKPKKGFRLPNLKPNFRLPKLGLGKPKSPPKARNFLWLWLLIILISYICMGYFLSVLLTMPARKNLAIAGFSIAALLPTVTAFADYALMKWGYLLSGILIVGGLFYFVNVRSYFLAVAIVLWIGITTMAFVGESLLKRNRKFFVVIIILSIPCWLGLGVGYKLWHWAATALS